MNINECGCRPYGWLGLDGNQCIRVIPRQLQCFSVNQTLFKELERHNVNHIIDQGKLTFRVSLLCKTSIRLSLSIVKLDLSLQLENS